MKKFIATASFTAVLLVSCMPKASTKSTTAGTSMSTKEQLVQGKTIFENSCVKCHKLPEPTSRNAVQWTGIMNSMAQKAKLTDEQHKWVYDYIVSMKN